MHEGEKSGVLLCNALLIDGLGGAPEPDGALLLDGGKVAWAGSLAAAPTEVRDARRVDLGGRTVCPGFIDTHVHFALPGRAGSPLSGVNELPSYRVLKVLDRLRVTLENGVTTARDLMGLDAGFRRALEERRIVGPRLRVAVSMLSQRAGHADFTLASGVDGYAAAVAMPLSPSGLVNSVDEVRLRVRELVAAGADCVKVASSGGVTSPHDQPDWLGMRPEMLRAVREEADAYGGLPVAAHAIGRPGIEAAVRSGVTSVEHGYALDDELRAEMVERGQFLVPTLLETLTDVDSPGVPPAVRAKSEHWHRVAQESVAASAAAGVRIALGTDSGLTASHGNNLKELGLLVRFAGMTPLQAISAGTAEAARLCGVDGITGTLEAGKAADLVVIGTNPLSDIDSLGDPRSIHAVLKEGRIAIDRAGVLSGSGLPGLQDTAS
ncbi:MULTISPECIES: amidohydrolase family protein [unclassified Streptomyces]|uniref:metal-dependent hydrolase family protein n=1 Tax=unclassified Streptomyces TaxID=2593676 RepID=UPI000DB9C3FA|nr:MULTISPECIES: amidohydrolase family protein [unclassified Streptomyces]MYT71679.1 amidohydrolase family protein [Streptomyces sp. SID8367]RAJ72929.1 imidazolonepropionase-like amidohydrolase [Streptomyces sp. PsTaAH-137]